MATGVPGGAAVSVLPIPCQNCSVQNRAVCRALDGPGLAELGRVSATRHYDAGQTIATEDEPAEVLGTVTEGVAKLTKTLHDGRRQIVGLLFPSDFLGRTFSESNAFTVEAATPLTLCAFPREYFHGFLTRHPEMEKLLLSRTLDELDAAREWMVLLGRKTARERIATFLAMLARRASGQGCSETPITEARFTLPLIRADIADYLGLTIETVSRQITRLKSAGLIQILPAKGIYVPDIAALDRAAEADTG